MTKSVEELQKIELALWDDLKHQDWLANLSNKLSEFRWLQPKLRAHDQQFRRAQTVLELGGGEGWASVVVKRLYPQAFVIASDISESAISGIDKWERIFEAVVDQKLACKSYSVPLHDNTVDLIFTFQAAHHFLLQKDSLAEAARLLRPGGVCMYLNEPSCRQYIHPLAKWRVNRKRPECPEDVLVLEEMRRNATEAGLHFDYKYSTETVNRGVIEGVYYKFLSVFPYCCNVLPCTADFMFTRS